MFFVLFMIALFRTFGTSMPINIITPRDEPQPMTSTPTYRLRTRFDIIWSCVATLFICTWIVIHPNVPPRGEGHIGSFWRRLKLMLWTLVVPELILIWAYRQWAAARYVAEIFKDEEWTATHGHFLIMGGFSLVRAGEETSVLDYESFFELLKIETERSEYWKRKKGTNYQPRFKEPFEVALPTITAAEIQDKARGDFLSKAIAILQTIWFIVQCIARGTQGLALTELELVTLALASLNGVMYFFWWDKPLGVNEPIKVYPSNIDTPKIIIEGAGRRERLKASLKASSQLSFVKRYLLNPLRRMYSVISQFPQHFYSSCGALLSSIHRLSSIFLSTIKTYIFENTLELPGHKYLWFLYFPIKLLFTLAESLVMIANSTEIDHNASYVPTFYAPSVLTADSEILYLFVLPIVATIFGALHLIAWQFHFPSHIEQLLWHIGSLAITIIPATPLVFIVLVVLIVSPSILLEFIEKKFGFSLPNFSISLPKKLEGFLEWVLIGVLGFVVGALGAVVGAGLVAYMLARILLLTQAVVLLRKQPDSAFYATNWSHFLPHI